MNKNILFPILTLVILLTSCGKSSNSNNEQIKIIQSALLATPSTQWQVAQKLIITFLDGTPEQKDEVARFTSEWTTYANIDFIFYPSIKSLPRNVRADIVITFNGKGNYSTTGKASKSMADVGQASMSLSLMGERYAQTRRYIILHEFGHALGLQHEHQHPERTFRFDLRTAQDLCKKHFEFDEDTCTSNIITATSAKGDVYFSKYDPLSIMHYAFHKDFFAGKAEIIHTNSLSLLDKIEIANLYPGRMHKNKIIELHNQLMTEVESTTIYKNCKILETIEEKSRFNEAGEPITKKMKTYGVTSIREDDGLAPTPTWTDKEGVVTLMKNMKYCNYDAAELEAHRAKQVAERLKKNKYKNCYIPINSDGTPTKRDEKDTYALYRIMKVNSIDAAIPEYYALFSEAEKIQRELAYCNYNDSELRAHNARELKEKMQKKQYGNCTIPLNSDGSPVKSVCDATGSLYTVQLDNNAFAVNLCFSTFTEAEKAQRESNVCNYTQRELENYLKEEAKKNEKVKCIIKNGSKTKKRICMDSSPWYIDQGEGKNIDGRCYSDFKSATNEKLSLKQCRD